MPLTTLETNTRAWSPSSSMVKSHGLSRNVPSIIGLPTRFPLRSMTCSDAPDVMDPPEVGRLPT